MISYSNAQNLHLSSKVALKVKAPIIPFSNDKIKLGQGSPFYNAKLSTLGYLLRINPDRLLHRFHVNAGLPPKGTAYGGWESEGLSGHTLGHYLSACALNYAEDKDIRFKQKIDYIVNELGLCQQARKTGYVGAIPKEDSIFSLVSKGIIRSSGFDLNGGWSPWYTVHKVMAGLLDAYTFAENKQALTIVKGIADWTYNTIHHLPDSTIQQMLKCEYGGMNDVLSRLYGATGEKKYLTLSYVFFDDFVMKPLSEKKDIMPGKHSNTNVPKAIGSAIQYLLTGNKRDHTIADFFWETMTHHHSYVIGGNSNYEYCGEADHFNDRLSDNTCETCNTYNMLKLTQLLFSIRPDAKYYDYYERALYNHILASQNAENGMMCYFLPLRMGTKKIFSDSFNTFTCCVGTGMENHVKYNEAIFSQSADHQSLYVNLFIPAQLDWNEKQAMVKLTGNILQSSSFHIAIHLEKEKTFDICIRKPYWVDAGFNIKINGHVIKYTLLPSGYISIHRKWRDGDNIDIDLPMNLHTESLPDNHDRIAMMYGPIVLAGALGDSLPDQLHGIPVLLTSDKDISHWLRKVSNEDMTFKMHNVGKPFDATLRPLYTMNNQYYTVYWDYFTPQQWESKKSAYLQAKEKEVKIAKQTIDYFRIGEMQPERDHKLVATERSYVDSALGVNGREARSQHHFSFTMKVDTSIAIQLLLVYLGDDKKRIFDVQVDGQLLFTESWDGGEANTFYTKIVDVPVNFTSNKNHIEVKILANHGTTTCRIFGVRTLRK